MHRTCKLQLAQGVQGAQRGGCAEGRWAAVSCEGRPQAQGLVQQQEGAVSTPWEKFRLRSRTTCVPPACLQVLPPSKAPRVCRNWSRAAGSRVAAQSGTGKPDKCSAGRAIPSMPLAFPLSLLACPAPARLPARTASHQRESAGTLKPPRAAAAMHGATPRAGMRRDRQLALPLLPPLAGALALGAGSARPARPPPAGPATPCSWGWLPTPQAPMAAAGPAQVQASKGLADGRQGKHAEQACRGLCSECVHRGSLACSAAAQEWHVSRRANHCCTVWRSGRVGGAAASQLLPAAALPPVGQAGWNASCKMFCRRSGGRASQLGAVLSAARSCRPGHSCASSGCAMRAMATCMPGVDGKSA